MFSKNNKRIGGARPLAVVPSPKPRARWRWRSLFETTGLYLCLIVALLFVLLVWASAAKLDQVVRVDGKIIPAGRSQQIQHLEGGIIASISTTEGASVKRGDLLLTIDSTTAGASLSETKTKLNNQRLHAIRLEAEAKDKNTVEFPPDLSSLPGAEAERNLFLARRAKLTQEILVHQDMIKQHSAEIEEAEENHVRVAGELTIAHQRSEMMTGMAGRGAASKLEVLDAQSQEQRLKTQLGEIDGSIPKLKATIAEEEARISAARTDFHTQAQNELVAAIGESEGLRQIVTAAADRLKRTEIRAPIDGVINRIYVNTEGGVVKPGDNLIELIPDNHQVLIEAKAKPRDRGYLRTGLNAEIRVSAYDAGELGLLKGRVSEVSADSMQDSRSEPYYQVDILVDSLPSRYADRVMVPGMTATADIVTGERTVLGYLLSPLRKFTYNMFRDPR